MLFLACALLNLSQSLSLLEVGMEIRLFLLLCPLLTLSVHYSIQIVLSRAGGHPARWSPPCNKLLFFCVSNLQCLFPFIAFYVHHIRLMKKLHKFIRSSLRYSVSLPAPLPGAELSNLLSYGQCFPKAIQAYSNILWRILSDSILVHSSTAWTLLWYFFRSVSHV